MPAMMNDSARAGPACSAAAVPVSTKIPVPMIPPIPRRVSAVAESVRCICCPFASASWISAIDLVAKSWVNMRPDSTQAVPAKPATAFGGERAACAGQRKSGGAQCVRYVRREELEQRRIDFWRAGHDVGAQAVLRAREGADVAPRLLDEERSGRRVPRREPEFPEPVDPAGGDISQIERRGAGAAHSRGALHGCLQHAEIGVDVVRVCPEGKTRPDEGALQRALLADPDAVVVEMRAGAAGRGKELLAHGIVD